MKRNLMKILLLCLCVLMMLPSVLAMDMMPPDMMGPPPEGGPGGSGGGPSDSGPENGAFVFRDGVEDLDAEYEPGAWTDYVTVEDGIYTLSGLDIQNDDYTFNGLVITGADSRVRLANSTIYLGVGTPTDGSETGGAATNIADGATLYISDSSLTVDGAARYVTANYGDATLIVNNSRIVSTGSNENTAQVAEPFSNAALMISGTARANFSIGATKTYYFNSVCMAEGWAALSTDSATGNGLDLYAYNTEGIAENGGYATYADTNCRVWLYGSRLTAAEIGCIISKSGQIHAYNSGDAEEELLQYNEGDTVTENTSIIGGRNAVMIHAPDMMGTGIYAADCGTFEAEDTYLGTTRELVSTKDYYDYGEATGKYIDYVSGSVFLIRSTSANIDLSNVEMESYNNTLIQTVLNCDSMGNFLADGDGALVNPIAVSMEDMDVVGDIRHEDYQRLMTVELENTTLSGNIVSGTMEDWNALWADCDPEETVWVVNDSYETVLGVHLTLEEGAVWNVTGESSLTSLTVEEGAVINGEITLDGEVLEPVPGEVYTGNIQVVGNYVPEPEEEVPAEEAVEEAPAVVPTADNEAVEEAPASAASEASAAENAVESAPAAESSGTLPVIIVISAVVVIALIAAAVVVLKKKK